MGHKVKPKIEIGDVFGMLTVTDEPIHNTENIRSAWYILTKCECGNTKELRVDHLLKKETVSCGCITRTRNRLSGHKLFPVWQSMISRCYKPKNHRYEYYGGDGVEVCDEWRTNFIAFFNWAIANGWKEGLQLDKDILYKKKFGTQGKLYSPDYCQFITHRENMRHKRNSLSKAQVNKIRKLYASGKYTLKGLGEKYNRCQSAISAIVQYINWKD